ncbi:hypothetical protein ARMSODRAFT_1089337 [Armillaria solidipes]|uniref:Protein kinase domain-containing protein n=1 Tax=Armillaria solidipes TaxID=1076256 RepID=A0A2H3BBR2_9AGAR|nr:hypothetical protein ARMSODRAFT_1089337 [Armillaria solidipes]
MKILQSSLLPPPRPYAHDHPCMEYTNPRQLAGTENLLYNELQSPQGSIILYYYRLHKLEMPNGEIARVLLLEYVEAETVSQWLKSYPPHQEGPTLDATLGEDYIYTVKVLCISMVLGFKQINEKGVIHFDARSTNMIITKRLIVFHMLSTSLSESPTTCV